MIGRAVAVGFAALLLVHAYAAAAAGQAPPASQPNATESPRIDSGSITGFYAGEKKDVRVFRGIPYAAPPVGPLRWRPPQPVKPWDGVRPCAEFGPSCPQPRGLIGGSVGRQDEDCLYLNVWTPAKDAGAKLPVMVWIHGGGCTTGSGSQPWYDGLHFARSGGVLVAINYRLGPLGFLAHPLLSKESDKNVSGNYGFLDQIAALQWVHRNVAAFGGDPGCVTIFGESAGSASVARLMVSPLAKGLFHRAIAQSGGAEGRNRHLRETRGGMEPMEKLGERIAEKLGCDKAPDPLAALRAKTPEEILAASNPAQGLFGKGNKFGWIVDGWALPDDPGLLFEEGRQRAVPLMAGFNANEGTIFLRDLPIQGAVGYNVMLRTLFGAAAPEARRLFPIENDDVPAALDRLVTLMSFGQPARAMARAMDKASSPAYLYYFTRAPMAAASLRLGAFHSQEIVYVFGNLPSGRGYDQQDRDLSETMHAYWTNFAKTGDPNGPGLPRWTAYDAASDAIQELGTNIATRAGLFKDAFDFLEQRARRQSGNRGQETPPASSALPREPLCAANMAPFPQS